VPPPDELEDDGTVPDYVPLDEIISKKWVKVPVLTAVRNTSKSQFSYGYQSRFKN